MGLDWILTYYKPKPGFEEEFNKIEHEMEELGKRDSLSVVDGSEQRYKHLSERFDEISTCALDEIGAPRIGYDVEADEWFKVNIFDEDKKRAAEEHVTDAFRNYWKDITFEQAIANSKGKYVTELAKDKEGFGTVLGMLCSDIDFRGKVVAHSNSVIGDILAEEAFDDHTAEECLDYADRLEKALEEFREADMSDSDKENYIEDAILWLRYWGSRGYGYYAWS